MEKTKQQNNPYDVDSIQRRVAEDIKRPVQSLEDLESFLAKWWCRHYNKPYKCADVKEYTLEELMYEYFDIVFRNNPEVLEKYLTGEKESSKDDEEWLKRMMGEGYMDQDTQEEQLSPMKETVDAAVQGAKEDSDEFSFKFNEFK